MRYLFVLLIGVALFIFSCEEKKVEYPTLDEFTDELVVMDSVKLGQFIFKDLLISDYDRKLVFASLSDTTRPISEAIALSIELKIFLASIGIILILLYLNALWLLLTSILKNQKNIQEISTDF